METEKSSHTIPPSANLDKNGEIENLKQRIGTLECELEEMRAESQQLVYAISHDLQEPLRMISSYIQLIDRRCGATLGREGLEFLEFVTDGATRLKGMLQGLLEYSRVWTRGKPFQECNLNLILKEILHDLEFKIIREAVNIQIPSLPSILADPDQIYTVFYSILDNAIKFRPVEIPRIEISVAETEQEWIFSISDNGIGIKEKDHKSIFRMFRTLHPRGTYNGFGLGLPVAKRIVERHGGRIWVDSAERTGTIIKFTISKKPSLEQRKNGMLL